MVTVLAAYALTTAGLKAASLVIGYLTRNGFPTSRASSIGFTEGYAVRLWVAPIQIHPGTEIFEKAFPDNVLKDKAGQPAFYTGLGTFRIDSRENDFFAKLYRKYVKPVQQQTNPS